MDQPFHLGPGHLKAIAEQLGIVVAKGGHGEVTIVLKKARIFEVRTTTSLKYGGNGGLEPGE